MSQTVDPFDELASMFLTGDEATVPQTGAAATGLIELLVVGHLPVRAGLWLTPYADALARHAGPVALMRLDGEEPAIQVLRSGDDPLPAEPGLTLRAAVEHLAGEVGAWIVRPDSRAGAQALLAAGADRVTILTGSDQAAVVAAYRIIKDLAAAAREEDVDLPEIGLAVIGCEERDAADIVGPLNRTTRQCLDLAVPMTLCLPRIDADIRTTGFRSFPEEAPAALEEIVGWIEQARWTTPAPPAAAVVQNGEPEAMKMSAEGKDRGERADAVMPVDIDIAQRAGEHEEREPAPLPAWGPLGGAKTTGAVRLATKAAVEMKADPPEEPPMRRPEAAKPTSLADHIRGLNALQPRCPGHEKIELAVDADGAMHLLGRDDALRELRIVEAWVKAHHELLAMACPGHRLDPARPVISHVFTDEPTRVADLHATDLHLHVLAPVEVEGKRGWYTAPLNDPA